MSNDDVVDPACMRVTVKTGSLSVPVFDSALRIAEVVFEIIED